MTTKKTRSAAAIGRQNRQKGRKAEQAVVDFLKEAGYLKARRWPSNMPAPVTGQKPPDLIVPELPWLAAEVKHAEDMTPWKLMDQAETQCTVGQFPVGFMRKDSRAGPGQPSDRPMVVVMKPVDWLGMMKLAELGRHAEAHAGGHAGGGKTATLFHKGTGFSLQSWQTQEAAKAWLQELRDIAGPARDKEAIRDDLVELSRLAKYQREVHVLERLAKDLVVGPLREE